MESVGRGCSEAASAHCAGYPPRPQHWSATRNGAPISRDSWTSATARAWAKPLLDAGPVLCAEIAVFHTAVSVAPEDTRLLGSPTAEDADPASADELADSAAALPQAHQHIRDGNWPLSKGSLLIIDDAATADPVAAPAPFLPEGGRRFILRKRQAPRLHEACTSNAHHCNSTGGSRPSPAPRRAPRGSP
jgi:hypothetical protein